MFKESIGNQSVRCRYYTHRKSPIDLEDVGGKVSFKADCARGYFVEHRNASSNGLLRYLSSRVGANWDKVFSDLKRQFRKEAMYDLVGMVDNWVMTHTYLSDDGVVMARRDAYVDVPVAETYYRFYVHPTSRCLQRIEVQSLRSRNRARKPESDKAMSAIRQTLPDGTLAMNLDGVWYRVELAALPHMPDRWSDYMYFDPRDAVLNRYLRHLTRWQLIQAYGVSDVYAVSKQQLSHKDIIKFGLPV